MSYDEIDVSDAMKQHIRESILRAHWIPISDRLPVHLQREYEDKVEKERQRLITQAVLSRQGVSTGRPKSRRERMERRTAANAAAKGKKKTGSRNKK